MVASNIILIEYMNCTKWLNSRKVQRFFKKELQKTKKEFKLKYGEIPANFERNFKNGFKQGFMDTCKTRKNKMNIHGQNKN